MHKKYFLILALLASGFFLNTGCITKFCIGLFINSRDEMFEPIEFRNIPSNLVAKKLGLDRLPDTATNIYYKDIPAFDSYTEYWMFNFRDEKAVKSWIADFVKSKQLAKCKKLPDYWPDNFAVHIMKKPDWWVKCSGEVYCSAHKFGSHKRHEDRSEGKYLCFEWNKKKAFYWYWNLQ